MYNKDHRHPDMIMQDINDLEWKRKDLEEELAISMKVYNMSDFKEWVGKWVLADSYETGFAYIKVLGVTGTEDDLIFYGYGIEYDAQSQNMEIVPKDFPKDFNIYYPDNLKEINPKFITTDLIDFLRLELEEQIGLDYELPT